MKRLFFVVSMAIALATTTLMMGPAPSTPEQFNNPKIESSKRHRSGDVSYSTNWAGYAVESSFNGSQNGVVTDVKAQWTVPSVTCGSTSTYSSIWVGIDGYSSNTVEQIGTEQDCSGGQPVYSAWWEMYPKTPSITIGSNALPVNAGDVIAAEVHYVGNNQFQLNLANNSKNKSFSTTQTMKAKRSSAEWIVEAPWSGGVLPLANFGNMQFGSISTTLHGTTGTITQGGWQNTQVVMVTSSGTVKAQPNNLSADGTSFGVQWQHN